MKTIFLPLDISTLRMFKKRPFLDPTCELNCLGMTAYNVLSVIIGALANTWNAMNRNENESL